MEMDFGVSIRGGLAGPGSWSRGGEGGEGQGEMRWKAGVKGGPWDMGHAGHVGFT